MLSRGCLVLTSGADECPVWQDFIKERFDRCLDLYLCPRVRTLRYNMPSEDLIPSLPNPRDLEPFP